MPLPVGQGQRKDSRRRSLASAASPSSVHSFSQASASSFSRRESNTIADHVRSSCVLWWHTLCFTTGRCRPDRNAVIVGKLLMPVSTWYNQVLCTSSNSEVASANGGRPGAKTRGSCTARKINTVRDNPITNMFGNFIRIQCACVLCCASHGTMHPGALPWEADKMRYAV